MTDLFSANLFLPNSSGLGYGTKIFLPRTTHSEFLARRNRRRLLKTAALFVGLTVWVWISSSVNAGTYI